MLVIGMEVVIEIMGVDDIAQRRNIKKYKDRTFAEVAGKGRDSLLFEKPKIKPEMNVPWPKMSRQY